MPSYSQNKYCPACQKNVSAGKDEKCKICGGKIQRRNWTVRDRVLINGVYTQIRLSNDTKGNKFDTKSQAQKGYIDYMSKYSPEAQEKVKYLYDTLLEKYLDANKHETKESTQYDKAKIFPKFITPKLTGTYVNDYTQEFLYDWQMALWNTPYKGKYYSSKYLIKIRSYLHGFLDWVERIYKIPNNLTIPPPKRKEQKEEIMFWEIKQFKKFITLCNFDEMEDGVLWKTYCYFSFYTGMRIGEIQAFPETNLSLNYPNISRVRVSQTLTTKTTDGTLFKITETKNYKNYKKKIPKVLAKVMCEYITWKRENNIPSDFLFNGFDEDGYLKEKTIRRALDELIIKANGALNNLFEPLPRITPHGFRHSYVSMLVHLGKSPKLIAELIGDTEETVLKTYSHMYKNDGDQAIDEIDELVARKGLSPFLISANKFRHKFRHKKITKSNFN